MKILSNLPIENLTKENDYLGIIEKGDMIVSLLKSDAVDLSAVKMFARTEIGLVVRIRL